MLVLRLINRRMWIKFILLFFVFFILAGGLAIWLNIGTMQKLHHQQIIAQSTDMVKTIENTVFDALAAGDNDTVKQQFHRLGSAIDDMVVFMYDAQGKIAFATQKSAMGSSISSHVDETAVMDITAMMNGAKNSDTIFQTIKNQQAFAVASRVILNEETCHGCHDNTKPVLGGITVLLSQQHALDAIDSAAQKSVLMGMVFLCLIMILMWLCFHFMVNNKTARMLTATESMRKRDFTISTQMPSGDEMNHILNRIHLVNQEIRGALKDVVDTSSDLHTSAADLTRISITLNKRSQETSVNSNSVASAAEQMSTNLGTISSSMEDAASHLDAVVSASREMSATVQEISQNAHVAKDVVAHSVSEFSHLSKVIDTLGKDSEDIDTVTREISGIAEQVGLLALNAKIEAARAGEAGKGFAVVAREITDLSQEAGISAAKVDKKIKNIRRQVKRTVSEIKHISEKIHESDDAISNIAASVEEQSAASGEVAGSLNEVSKKISEVRASVSEGASAASEIAGRIGEVDAASAAVNENSSEVNNKAENLSRMADRLQKLVGRFTI